MLGQDRLADAHARTRADQIGYLDCFGFPVSDDALFANLGIGIPLFAQLGDDPALRIEDPGRNGRLALAHRQVCTDIGGNRFKWG